MIHHTDESAEKLLKQLIKHMDSLRVSYNWHLTHTKEHNGDIVCIVSWSPGMYVTEQADTMANAIKLMLGRLGIT